MSKYDNKMDLEQALCYSCQIEVTSKPPNLCGSYGIYYILSRVRCISSESTKMCTMSSVQRATDV